MIKSFLAKKARIKREMKELIDEMYKQTMENQTKSAISPIFMVRRDVLDDMRTKIEKRQNSLSWKIKSKIMRGFGF